MGDDGLNGDEDGLECLGDFGSDRCKSVEVREVIDSGLVGRSERANSVGVLMVRSTDDVGFEPGV